jgi:hypothetical protein
MHRRSFVRASVLGATTTGLASACSQAHKDANAPTSHDDTFANNLALLDRGMDDLRCRPIKLGRVASKAANTPLVCREDPLDEQLYRSSLRALLLTGSIKDLPEADRSRPEVQARLDAHAAEVDFAVHGMTHRLAHMPPDELARVQDRLQQDPHLAQRIIEYIDDEAHKSDFPLARRLRLRRLARIALWRLRHQPVEMVVHECTDKVQRLSKRLTPIARDAPFARPRSEDVAYWEAQTLRVVERYQDAVPPAPEANPRPDDSDSQRALADQERAAAESMVTADPAGAAAKFDAAASMYERAAIPLIESHEHSATRADLLDLAMTMHMRSYELTPSDATTLRVARKTLQTHDIGFRQAYGESRSEMPEYTRLQAHFSRVRELLRLDDLRRPPVESANAKAAAMERRVQRRRRLLRTGGIVLGVGLGLLALGLGLVIGGAMATGHAAAGIGLLFWGGIVATAAGITLIVGIVLMVVGGASKI